MNESAPATSRWGSYLEGLVTPGFVRFVAHAIFILVFLALAAAAFLRPDANWDMVPYIAVAMEDDTSTPQDIHAEVWQLVRNAVPPDQFALLSDGDEFRKQQYRNPEMLQSVLGMYRVKFVYTEILAALGPLTGYVTAIRLINVFGILLTGVVLFLWMRRFDSIDAFFFLVPVLLLAGYSQMAIAALPDTLEIAISLVALYLLRIDKPWWSIPVLVLAVAIRPDFLIFVFALLLSAVVLRLRIVPILCAFLVSVAVYLLITRTAGHPGWWPHFVFSNIDMRADMRGFDPPFSIVTYLTAEARGAFLAVFENGWPSLCLILLSGWVVLRRGHTEPAGMAALLFLAAVLSAGGKFAVFPLPDDRVYFLNVLVAAIVLLEAWRPKLALAGQRLRSNA